MKKSRLAQKNKQMPSPEFHPMQKQEKIQDDKLKENYNDHTKKVTDFLMFLHRDVNNRMSYEPFETDNFRIELNFFNNAGNFRDTYRYRLTATSKEFVYKHFLVFKYIIPKFTLRITRYLKPDIRYFLSLNQDVNYRVPAVLEIKYHNSKIFQALNETEGSHFLETLDKDISKKQMNNFF